MSRFFAAILCLSLLAAAACAPTRQSMSAGEAAVRSPASDARHAGTNRPGIVVVGTGGPAALVRITVLDSATGKFATLIRGSCDAVRCAPLDSASGSLDASEVRRLFELVESEHVFSLRSHYDMCRECKDRVRFTTAVHANGRRAVVTSDRDTTPAILGRVHVELAEAIRAARGED